MIGVSWIRHLISVWRLLVIVFILPCSRNIHAQSEFRFERISTSDGLSQSSVTSIVQGEYGYLWIGTLDGLNRYDGTSFKVYRHSSHENGSLPNNQISSLFLDRQQRLWVVTPGYFSLFNANEDNFNSYAVYDKERPNVNLYIRGVTLVGNDSAILSTQHGLFWMNLTNGMNGRYNKCGEMGHRSLFGYYRVGESELLVTEGYKVMARRRNVEWRQLLSHDLPIRGTLIDGHGLFFQTKDDLHRYDQARQELELLTSFHSDSRFEGYQQKLMRRSNGDYWLMHGVIDVYDSAFTWQQRITQIENNPQSLPEYLSAEAESSDGVVWIGTNGLGLFKYNPLINVFNFVGHFPGSVFTLSSEYVRCVYTADDELLYVGTLGGLDVIDTRKTNSFHVDCKNRQGERALINSVLKARDGRLWVGTSDGLKWFDGKRFHSPPVQVLSEKLVDDMSLDDEGNLLVATTQSVFLFDPVRNTCQVAVPTGTLVARKFDDTYWTENEGRIVLYKDGRLEPSKIYSYSPDQPGSFPKAWIKCFFRDSQGDMWIGTWGGGLIHFDAGTETFQQFDEADGLPNAVVYGILEDSQGNLWLSTNNGLCVFDKLKRKGVRSFYYQEGIQANEFNTGAYFKSPNGKMYFGGIRGLTYFNPASALDIEYPLPITVVRSILVNNQRVDVLANGQQVNQVLQGSTLRFSHSERNFGVEVTGLGFTAPGRTQYQFRLGNFIDKWTTAGYTGVITFTNVPAGTYKLEVKSSNALGEWEQEGLTLNIVVSAPLWRRPEFIAFVVVMAFLISFVVYRLRLKNLRAQQAYLECLVEDRTRELQLRNEEVAAQNEEIVTQNEELALQAEAIERRNIELETIRNSLEERVEERTQTLKKLNLELIENNNQLEQFTYITAHNLRGPVARLKGLIHLLSLGNESDLLRHLHSSVNNLDEVITDLNLVLNVRKGGGAIFEKVNLRNEFDLVVKSLEDDIASTRTTIVHHGDKELHVTGIKPYVYSIFYNLIQNAIKYSSAEREPVITCTCTKEGDKIRITIADNGIGIDMHYAKEKIFHLYQRFNTNTHGKGFGLFLVKTQVEAMGGSISVDSEPKVGTTFTIILPE